MPTVGIDCEIMLDGNGYFVKPESYIVRQPRLSKASYRADGGLAYVDLGPGRRTWSLTILALNELKQYNGIVSSLSGQQYRDALRSSYLNNIGATILFIDPLGGSGSNVYFAQYAERIQNLHSQIIAPSTGGLSGASYEITIELIEA
jgi:hypothetical protein